MKNCEKSIRGITLVALVITIIILLILKIVVITLWMAKIVKLRICLMDQWIAH